jgi:lipoprotein-anchoring transpeptidase ErfK/SrfK
VGIRKIVVGLSAVIAVGALAACSAGASSSAASPQVAVAADTASQANAPGTSTSDPTTTAPPTTTTPKTTAPVAPPVTKAPVVQAAAKSPGVPCSAAARACVDISARKAWLMRNGKVIYGPVSIMPGRVGWRTPTGTFHVEFKDANYFSHEFQVPMPDAVFFQPGIAFHVGSLVEHSHGCVHLSRASASTFFHTLSVGDEVQVVS